MDKYKAEVDQFIEDNPQLDVSFRHERDHQGCRIVITVAAKGSTWQNTATLSLDAVEDAAWNLVLQTLQKLRVNHIRDTMNDAAKIIQDAVVPRPQN